MLAGLRGRLVLGVLAGCVAAGLVGWWMVDALAADRLGDAATPEVVTLLRAVVLGAVLVAAGFGVATVWITTTTTRRALAQVAEGAEQIHRDVTRRIPIRASDPPDELRALATWLNYLAEDAQRSQQALGRERALLSAVAEGLTQGVIAVDAQARIELLNDAARKMVGVQSPLIGEALFDFVRVRELRELIERPEAGSAEIQLPAGPRMLVRVARKWGGDGRVLLLEDVTAMRRLETVRRDFVANVSHELRTPVAVIRANAETLMAGAKDDPVMAPKLIDGLHRNAERLARILADLLDLSRLDAGQYRLELGPVGVRGAIEQALTAVEPQATARKVEIATVIPSAGPDGEPIAIKGDPKALDQILVNLIDNAVKYTRPAGHVWVEAKADDTGVRIEVRDDGPGIAVKHRERVFERFYRADPSRSREAGGTGLGLSIVKHLVESMAGEVGVEPNAPAGSVFWLRLPRAAASQPIPITATPTVSSTVSSTVTPATGAAP
jgi:two-component system phosphate regulon sensor histidine kinase PhoR